MAIAPVCLMNDYSGAGGVAGGGGPLGAASTSATGKGVSNYGIPFLMGTTNTAATYSFQLLDKVTNGAAYDLTHVTSVRFIAKETMDAGAQYINKAMTVTDDEEGLVELSLAATDLKWAGIWTAAVVCYTGEVAVAEFKAYLEVAWGIAHDTYKQGGHPVPLGIFSVRMALRDFSAEYNTLLEDLEYSDQEILFAMQRPVDEWNDTPPAITQYTLVTFPWREMHLKATCGYLLQTAAHHYSRNSMNYSAGGVSIQDKAKAQEYLIQAKDLLTEWRRNLKLKKRELNTELCYGTVRSSAYGTPVSYTNRF